MGSKVDYIKNLAANLKRRGRSMTFDQLAADLNANGIQTTYDTPYTGGRGVAKLVRSVYYRLDGQGLDVDAENVAERFTNANGEYAWSK